MLLIGPPILRQCILSPPPYPPPKNPSFLNPCAQFFFALNPETVPENLTKLLEKSWNYDPLTTLKLIAYLRTCNGVNGVKGFYLSALWLHKTHPLTLSCNLREFSGFGSSSSLRDFAKIRFFHDRVSDLFADLLRSDLVSLKSGNVDLLSFASVDCPSIDSAIDRNTLLCESIARKIFPKDSDPSYDGIQDEYYVYRVRNRLRKVVLVPLRTAQIVLSMILKGDARVFPSTPLSVVSSLTVENKENKELEWSDMVNSFSKSGKLRNSVVICDVSDKMSETSRNVSASMGLLISELSDGPWKETVYGFNRSPKLQKIQGNNDLFSKLNFIKQLIICTDRVDMEAILNQILQLGISSKVNPSACSSRRVWYQVDDHRWFLQKFVLLFTE